jgi:hypothetical protein
MDLELHLGQPMAPFLAALVDVVHALLMATWVLGVPNSPYRLFAHRRAQRAGEHRRDPGANGCRDQDPRRGHSAFTSAG